MLNLGILDILIAMVVVILVLSLVVQSIQTLTKKVLKLKSHSIRSSLVDLFETMANKPAAAAALGAKLKTPQELVADVTDRLKDMGRKTLFGRPMLDSLAKGDLLKVLTRVKAEDLLPGTVTIFDGLLTGINDLKAELGKIDTNLLQGEASAKFAAMQGLIMPVLHDLEALASGGKFDPAVFFGDLYKLRQIKAADALAILGQIQQAVSQDLVAVRGASDAAHKALADAQQTKDQVQIDTARQRDTDAASKLTAVGAVDTGLKNIAKQIAALSTAFDAAFAPLFARLEQVEAWYDTVMQGFEERYTRHMKTVGLAISIGVVVFLNANFFSIYRALKADPVMTEAIGKQVPALLKTAQEEKARQSAGAANAANPSGTPASSASPGASPPVATSGARLPSPANGKVALTPSPSSAPTETPTTVADVKQAGQSVKDLVSTYESFGIKPLSRQQIYNVWSGNYLWRDVSETILGCGIMVMLLSAGAPFWEDTLESLFGLKNLLRQKSDTKNIEEEKGGQPKP